MDVPGVESPSFSAMPSPRSVRFGEPDMLAERRGESLTAQRLLRSAQEFRTAVNLFSLPGAAPSAHARESRLPQLA